MLLILSGPFIMLSIIGLIFIVRDSRKEHITNHPDSENTEMCSNNE